MFVLFVYKDLNSPKMFDVVDIDQETHIIEEKIGHFCIALVLEKDRGEFDYQNQVKEIMNLYIENRLDEISYIKTVTMIIIHDLIKERVSILRENSGKNTIYYTNGADGFFVSSNFKRILNHRNDKKINRDYFNNIFLLGPYVLNTYETPFNEILELPVGKYVVIQNSISVESIKEHSNKIKCYNDDYVEKVLKDNIYNYFYGLDSVDISLSGGLDSSLLFCMIKSLSSDIKLNIHSINAGERFDDFKHVKSLCEHFSIDEKDIHVYDINEVPITVDLFDLIISNTGLPIFDERVFSFYYLYSNSISNKFIAGHGPDEYWYGYYPMKWNWISMLYGKELNISSVGNYVKKELDESLINKVIRCPKKPEEIAYCLYEKMSKEFEINGDYTISKYIQKYCAPKLFSIDREMANLSRVSLITPFLDSDIRRLSRVLPVYNHIKNSGKFYLKNLSQKYTGMKEIINRKKEPFPKNNMVNEKILKIYYEYREEILDNEMVNIFFDTPKCAVYVEGENLVDTFYSNTNDLLLQMISLWRFSEVI